LTRPRAPASRGSFALLALIAVIGASCSGHSRSERPAQRPLTFSPRSSLERLDLRSRAVRPLDAGRFFAVAGPALSPSGRLAFVASTCASCPQRLRIVRGRHVSSLAQALSAAWMGRGRLVASIGHGEETDVWVLGPNGRGHELEWLTRAAAKVGLETEKDLVLSPNRRLLLFSGEGSGEHHGNYLVDLRRRRLSPLAGEAADGPTFAPDGRRIAYQQQVSLGGDWDLCIAEITVRVSSHRHCFRTAGANDREPAFLPSGRELVFSSDRASRRNGISSLYLLDLRTGSVSRLTPPGYDATSPKVAPGGRSVVFVRRALVRLR
jgi:hypothetical protein